MEELPPGLCQLMGLLGCPSPELPDLVYPPPPVLPLELPFFGRLGEEGKKGEGTGSDDLGG